MLLSHAVTHAVVARDITVHQYRSIPQIHSRRTIRRLP
jgi:hypothetical protein